MIRLVSRLVRALVLGVLFEMVMHAGIQWPQFRGVRASGVDTNRPASISWNVTTGSNILWQTNIPGFGYSSPILWDDRIYITAAEAEGAMESKIGLYGSIESVNEKADTEWFLLALNRTNGMTDWKAVGTHGIPRVKRHPKSSPCNSTPATDGEHIVALFGSEGMFCFGRDGKLLWQKDLGPMDSGYYAVPSAQWGFASSPVIQDGKVIVLCDVQKGSFLAAYDINNGKNIWMVDRKDVPTWGTPTVVTMGDRTQIVVNGWHYSGGYDFLSGKSLWRLEGGGDIPVPTPIFANELIYLTSAHGKYRPMRAIRPGATGNITPDEVGDATESIAWAHARQGNYMQTPIAVNRLIFGCLDIGLVTCFDAMDGKIRYSQRLSNGGDGFTSSPVSDGQHLYFASETGSVYVVPATGTFSILATNDLKDNCMATPALVDGTIYYRTRNKLIAVAEKR